MSLELIGDESGIGNFLGEIVSENMAYTPEGYLICRNVPITRGGTFEYRASSVPDEILSALGLGNIDPSTVLTVERPLSAIDSLETAASFEGKPFLIFHPSVLDPSTGMPKALIDPDIWADHVKGHMQNVRMGSREEGLKEDILYTDILIADRDAINIIANGSVREVSIGATPVWGVNKKTGRPTQEQVMGNHLAGVDKGRAGHEFAIADHSIKSEKKSTMFNRKKVRDAACDETNHLETDLGKLNSNLKAIKNKDEEIDREMKDEHATANHMVPPDNEMNDDEEEELLAHEMDDKSFQNRMIEFMERLEAKFEKAFGAEEEEMEDEDDMEMMDEEESHPSRPEYEARKHGENLAREEENEYEENKELKRHMHDRHINDAYDGNSQDYYLADILAPGIRKTRDLKTAAILSAYATKDGKKLLEEVFPSRWAINDMAVGELAYKLNKFPRVKEKIFVRAAEKKAQSRNAKTLRTAYPIVDAQEEIYSPHSANEAFNEMNKLFYKINK